MVKLLLRCLILWFICRTMPCRKYSMRCWDEGYTPKTILARGGGSIMGTLLCVRIQGDAFVQKIKDATDTRTLHISTNQQFDTHCPTGLCHPIFLNHCLHCLKSMMFDQRRLQFWRSSNPWKAKRPTLERPSHKPQNDTSVSRCRNGCFRRWS